VEYNFSGIESDTIMVDTSEVELEQITDMKFDKDSAAEKVDNKLVAATKRTRQVTAEAALKRANLAVEVSFEFIDHSLF
jgi:hypothetical protein